MFNIVSIIRLSSKYKQFYIKWVIKFCLLIAVLLCQSAFAATQVRQFGITWTFDRDYKVGQFANGDYWVVGPVNIVNIDPKSVVDVNGIAIHGTMVNPKSDDFPPDSSYAYQGFDSRLFSYNSSYNKGRPNGNDISGGNPLVVQPNSSVVSTISRIGPISWSEKLMPLLTAAVLTVLDKEPPANSFRPGYCGKDRSIKFNISDIDYSKLKSYTLVGSGIPSLVQGTGPHGSNDGEYQDDTFERMVERPWLDWQNCVFGGWMRPQYNIQLDGAWIARQVGEIALILNSNYSNAQKEKTLIRFLQICIDYYSIVDGNDKVWNIWYANGQTGDGRKFPILFAGMVLNDKGMSSIGNYSLDGVGFQNTGYISFGEDEQTFYVSQKDVDATHSAQWNPDPRGNTPTPYEVSDIGLPEWGIVHAGSNLYDNKAWAACYRSVGSYCGGFVLAAQMMGMKNLWNHNALFDYMDRFMVIEKYAQYPAWAGTMWSTYRATLGPVWPDTTSGNRPNADAGEDIVKVDQDLNGSEQVTLDGTGSSDSDGTIVSYVWTENGNQIATGQTPTVTLSTGQHNITLTVTDNSSLTDTDMVTVTVNNGVVTYVLSVSATNGSVTKTPNKSNYTAGEGVSLQAAANAGYSFIGWSGDLSGSSNPATVTMNANKSVTANFAINTYSLNITATNGSVTKTPNKTSYNYGETVSLQAAPNTGYNFSNWSGDASGSSNPATITMNSNKSVTANFSANSYTLTVSASNGSVAKNPDKASFSYGETVTLQATANTGYTFTGWSGDASGSNSSVTITMNANKSVTVNFTINTYSLNITATNGSVTKTPNKTSYNHGETVSLQAAPNTGYNFSNWSGDASGSSNPATITMNSNKSVTANFSANSYTLTVSASNGSVAKNPDKASFSYGETVTLQATANTGYTFTGWSGDASGSNSSVTITMNANKSVTANFAINTYSLNITANNGSVTKTPNKTSYNHGETVSLQAAPNTGYNFSNWSGDASGSSNPATVTINANKSVTANFALINPDKTAPYVTNCSPEPDSIQVTVNHLVSLNIKDDDIGVDVNTVTIKVNAQTVYPGSNNCQRTGTKADYTFTYRPSENFGFEQKVTITVDAADLSGNTMTPYNYSFWAEMCSFGSNKKVSSGLDKLACKAPAAVRDSKGNIWAVFHAGSTGRRDIYIGRLADGTDTFSPCIQLTTNSADQCNPAIALDAADNLYVVWQDNHRGNWDIYFSASIDGINWLPERRIIDSDGDEINPAVVVDRMSPNRAYVVWQDSRAGNQDIYIASSSSSFAETTVSRITSHSSDQVDPAIAVDSGNKVYVVWTDGRNGSTDIYGATSDYGPWTNVPVVNSASNQSSPVIAAESAGSVLHLLWVDDALGNKDIYYAKSNGLRDGPLAGRSIIDDSSMADQTEPTIAVTGSTGNKLKIFTCWQDGRITGSSTDTDLYFVDVGSDGRTNVFVGDGNTNKDQSEPALGADRNGYPYIVWSDSRNKNSQIYWAGSTYLDPEPLASKNVSASTGAIVGTPLSDIQQVGDVSIIVPPGACESDTEITISKVENPPALSIECLASYDFGPSGLYFNEPVTITIPYEVSGNESSTKKPYWYNALTGAPSQQGISDVKDIVISDTLHAIQFKTTHFTQFFIGTGDTDTGTADGSSDDGGCSLSTTSDGNVVQFLLPYMLLAMVMVVLKLRDARRT